MKIIKQFSFIGLAIALVLTSCTIEKRAYMSGYHIDWKKYKQNSMAGYHIDWKKSKQNPDRQELANNKNDKPTVQGQIEIIQQSEKESKMIDNALTVYDETITASVDNSIIPLTTPSQQKRFSVITLLEEYDNIILKNGEEIKAKVTEITTDEIKYKKWDNINGPTYSIKKSEVLMIKYSNGTKDIITPNNSTTSKNVSDKTQNDTEEKKGGGFGIASFVLSLVGPLVAGPLVAGLLVASVIMGPLAIIFGIIGMINRKLKGLAIAGLIIGIIDLIVLILVAAVL